MSTKQEEEEVTYTTDGTATIEEAASVGNEAAEALAAAAAAAVAAEAAVITVVETAAQAETSTTATNNSVIATTAAAAAAPTTNSRVSILNEEDGQGKRRFFPRVKHLIGNKEWEDFLTQVLQCIEEAGAPDTAAASHKANNAWYKAFDLIYGGVASEYSIPTGKNRYHKFKDKILEVWVALENQAPGENHCRQLSMEQYDRYRQACAEANKNSGAGGSGGGGGSGNNPNGTNGSSNKAAKMGGLASPGGASSKLAGGKRSYNTAMGGGPSVGNNNAGSNGTAGAGGLLWKNLDEAAVLAKLPQPLQSLVHLKQLSKEMAVGTGNRAARKGIEEHGKSIDGAYFAALTNYLNNDDDDSASAIAAISAVTAEEDNMEGEDAAMADGDDANANDDHHSASASDATAKKAYDRSLCVAFLYRYASTLNEQKVLAEAYTKYTTQCVTFVTEGENNSTSTSDGLVVTVAAVAAANAATGSGTDVAAAVANAAAAAVAATTEDTTADAAAAAATAMDDTPFVQI